MDATASNQTLKSVFLLLKLTFGIVPIVAGIDKFTDILDNWDAYVNPSIAGMLPVTPHVFMMIVGVIEIIAGALVLAKPGIGGYVVAGWLTLVALTLIASMSALDVAVRDLVMAIAAFSMARIAKIVPQN